MHEQINADRRRFLSAAAMTVASARLAAIGAGSDRSTSTNTFGAAETGRCRRPERRIRGRRSGRRSSRWCFSTAGPTTSTATSTSPQCSPRKATGCSFPICAAMERHVFSQPRQCAMASSRRWPSDCRRVHGCARDRASDHRRVSTGAHEPRTSSRRSGRQRCKALVSVSGYLIGSREANKMPLPPQAELQWWYQYYFATERGRAGYDKYRNEFAKLIWQIASPKWQFDDATFDRSAKAFDNPDHVQHRDPQLPLASRARQKASRSTTISKSSSQRARSSRCPRSRSKVTPMAHHTPIPLVCQEVLRQVFAPAPDRRHRSQPAAGSAARVCRRDHRGGSPLK